MPPADHGSTALTAGVDSVHVVTNDTGAAINRTEYLPFGETWFTEGEKAYAPKFNSQELDKESGLYFFNARHQDPELGRFETADTVIDGEYSTQGWNRYSYVHNNPVRYKDPTGHWRYKAAEDTAPTETAKSELGSAQDAPTPEASKNLVEGKLQKAPNTEKFISPVRTATIDKLTSNKKAGQPRWGSGFLETAGRKSAHKGQDVMGAGGDEIVAMKSGKIRFDGSNKHHWGRHAIIEHDDGTESIYAHMTEKSFKKFSKEYADRDGKIDQGDQLGVVGNTGKPLKGRTELDTHLHFAIRSKNADAFDVKKKTHGDGYTYFDPKAILKNQ